MITGTLTCVGAGGTSTTSALSSYLTPELQDIVRAETDAWIKSLRSVMYDGRSMRARFTYRHDSLWWFTELYLHRRGRLERAVATIVALDAAREQLAPSHLAVTADDLAVLDAAHTFGRVHQLPVDSRGGQVERERHARNSYLTGLTATMSRLRPTSPVFLPTHTSVAAVVPTSFRPRVAADHNERLPSYVPQVLDAVAARVGAASMKCIGVGPRRHLRRERSAVIVTTTALLPVTPIQQLAPHGQLGGAIEVWRRRSEFADQLTSGGAIRAAGHFRTYDLWQVLRRELEAAAMHQWPWAARAMDEATAALGAVKPDVLISALGMGAWGRALLLEARRRQIPTVLLPEEIAGRRHVTHGHEPDEMAIVGTDHGFPTPDRLLTFDSQIAAELEEIGHYPRTSVVVTGHPKTDGLRKARRVRMTAEQREEFRRSLQVGPGQRLALLVARFSEVSAFVPAIAAAAAAQPGMHVAIKTHPSDAPELYGGLVAPAPNISVVPDHLELARLLAAADGIITRESTVAIDALALGVPSLIIGTPDHLGPLVDAGIMLGSPNVELVASSLNALLYDDQVRKRLRRVVGVQNAADAPQAGAAELAAGAIVELRPKT